MPSTLVCIVVVEMAKPDVPRELMWAWKQQRDTEIKREGSEQPGLRPEPKEGQVQVWKGEPDGRDWDRLVACKTRDGWRLLSHRREFVHRYTEEVADKVDVA